MAIQHVASRTLASQTSQAYTFFDVPLGAAVADRYIFVTARGARGNQTLAVADITVAGAATTEVAQALSGVACAAIRRTSNPLAAGETGTIIVTFNNANGSSGCQIDVYAVDRLKSTTPHDTDVVAASGNTITGNLDVPANGGVIAAALGVRSANNSWLGSSASDEFVTAQAGHAVNALHDGSGITWAGLDEDGEDSFYAGGATANYMRLAAASFAFVLPPSDGLASGSSSAVGAARAVARGAAGASSSAAALGKARAETHVVAAASSSAGVLGKTRAEARGDGAAAGFATAHAAGVVPTATASGAATASGDGRSDVRAVAAAPSIAFASGVGRTLRRYFLTADSEGAFSFEFDLPPGTYIARARASDGGPPTAWSTSLLIEAGT